MTVTTRISYGLYSIWRELLFIGSRPLKLEGTSVLWWDIILWKSEGDVMNIPYGNWLEVYEGLMHLISWSITTLPICIFSGQNPPSQRLGYLAPPKLQKWVFILQISGGRTSIFFPTIAYFCHLFLYKMWLFVIFSSHFLSGIYQTMNWQGQCQKLLRSYQILLACNLTYSGFYHKKFLQGLPWWMVTFFFPFLQIFEREQTHRCSSSWSQGKV